MKHTVEADAINEILYRQSVAYLQKKRQQGFLTEEQYAIAEGYLAREYRIFFRIL